MTTNQKGAPMRAEYDDHGTRGLYLLPEALPSGQRAADTRISTGITVVDVASAGIANEDEFDATIQEVARRYNAFPDLERQAQAIADAATRHLTERDAIADALRGLVDALESHDDLGDDGNDAYDAALTVLANATKGT